MKKLLLPLVAFAALVAGAGPATTASTATKTVQIKRSAFQPSTVTIKTGDVVKWTGPPPSVTIGASLPIIVYGQQVTLSGAVSSGNANEKVTIYQQPYPQASLQQLTTVLTTTGGAWQLVLSPSPKILTQFQARWQGRTSITVGVQVRPRIRLSYRRGRFYTAVQSATSHAGKVVLAQRLSRFGQWVTLKKVRLGGKSTAVFRMRLPKGKSRIRVAMSVNQAGGGYLA